MTDEARYDYMSQRAHRAWCAGFLVLAGVLGGATSVAYSAIFGPGGEWPYEVIERQIVANTVDPGGEIGMRRMIEYHEEDCWRQYDRRAVSLVQTGEQPGRVQRFEPWIEQKLPVDLSGKWQTWTDRLADDFPCGPAYLAETVTAACTQWQRKVRLLRKPDVITGFTVACPVPG